MGFNFKDIGHFRNTVLKHVREQEAAGRDVPQNLLDDDQFEKVWKHNAKKFSWQVKEDARYADAYNIDIWLRDTPPSVKYQPDSPHVDIKADVLIKSLEDNAFVPPPIALEFRQYVHSDLTGKTGCIELMFSENCTVLIEHAEDLSANVFKTYDRLAKYQKPIFMRAYFTVNVADALILKAYLISYQDPILNREYNSTNGKPTLSFNNMPIATDMIQVNKIEGGE